MDVQETLAIRVTAQRAEWLLAVSDALVLLVIAVGGRVALTEGTLPALLPTPAAWAWQGVVLALVPALLLSLHGLGHYDCRRPSWREFGDIAIWTAVVAGIDAGLAIMVGLSPLTPLVLWATAGIAMLSARMALRSRLDALGLWKRPTIIVGTGPNARAAAQTLIEEPELGLPVVAFAPVPKDTSQAGGNGFAPPALPVEVAGQRFPVVALDRLLGVPTGGAHPHIVVAPETNEIAACSGLFEHLGAADCEFDFLPPLLGLAMSEARIGTFAGRTVPAFRLRDRLADPLSRLYKRTFDLAIGLPITILTAPLLAGIALAVLVLDGRPILFVQNRVGMRGERFRCFKFRTMVPDAEARLADLLERDPVARAEWARDQKLRDDPRISRLGAWLRRTSLDELPQLFNVLKGEMSLIGPRPVVPDELTRYGQRAGFYLKTRPGLSGLWQVSGRNDVDYQRRVDMDCRYIRHWSPWWDLALLFATVRVVFARRGAY